MIFVHALYEFQTCRLYSQQRRMYLNSVIIVFIILLLFITLMTFVDNERNTYNIILILSTDLIKVVVVVDHLISFVLFSV